MEGRVTLPRLLAGDVASLVARPTWIAAAVVVPFFPGPVLRIAIEMAWTPRGADRAGWVVFSLVLSAFLGAVAAAWEGILRARADGEWEARLVLPIARGGLWLAHLLEGAGSALLACGVTLASLAIAEVRMSLGDVLLVPALAVAAAGSAQAMARGGRGLGTLLAVAAMGGVLLAQPSLLATARPWLLPGSVLLAVAGCAAALRRKEVAPHRVVAEAAPAPDFRPPGLVGPRPVHGAAYLALAAAALLAGHGLLPTDPLRFTLVFELGVILFPALFLATVTSQPYRESFRAGWPGGGRLVGAVVAAVCFFVLLREVSLLHFLHIPKEVVEELFRPVQGCLSHGAVMALLALAVLPALCEDLAFRGYLLTSLVPAAGPAVAVTAAAVPFALLHPPVQRMPGMFAFGIVYGTLVWRWGSIWVGVTAHLVHNTLVLAPLLWPLFVPPWMREEAAHSPPEVVVAAALVLGLLLMVPPPRGRVPAA